MLVFVTSGRRSFCQKAGTLGRVLTHDDFILSTIDSLFELFTKLSTPPKFSLKRPNAIRGLGPVTTAAFALPPAEQEKDRGSPSEDDEDDSLLPQLSKYGKIPNALSDEKFLLASNFIDEGALSDDADGDDDDDWVMNVPEYGAVHSRNLFVASSILVNQHDGVQAVPLSLEQQQYPLPHIPLPLPRSPTDKYLPAFVSSPSHF